MMKMFFPIPTPYILLNKYFINHLLKIVNRLKGDIRCHQLLPNTDSLLPKKDYIRHHQQLPTPKKR